MLKSKYDFHEMQADSNVLHKQEVELKPVGDKLEAKGSFKVPAGTKVVAVVSLAGKSSTARFVLK